MVEVVGNVGDYIYPGFAGLNSSQRQLQPKLRGSNNHLPKIPPPPPPHICITSPSRLSRGDDDDDYDDNGDEEEQQQNIFQPRLDLL